MLWRTTSATAIPVCELAEDGELPVCFKSPTSYVNCQNPDNDQRSPRQEHERGIAFEASKSIVGQVTIHTDHPFWDSVLHDSPAHFDQFAARVVPPVVDGGVATDAASDGATSDGPAAAAAATTPTVTLDMTMGVDYRSYTDSNGNPLKWRYCMDPPTDVHAQLTGAMAFDPQSVPPAQRHRSHDGPARLLRLHHLQPEHAGHLNSDSLCALQRHYCKWRCRESGAEGPTENEHDQFSQTRTSSFGSQLDIVAPRRSSVSSLVVAMERWLYLRRRAVISRRWPARWTSTSRAATSRPRIVCSRRAFGGRALARTPAPRRSRHRRRGQGDTEPRRRSSRRLERWLAYLATVGNNAPASWASSARSWACSVRGGSRTHPLRFTARRRRRWRRRPSWPASRRRSSRRPSASSSRFPPSTTARAGWRLATVAPAVLQNLVLAYMRDDTPPAEHLAKLEVARGGSGGQLIDGIIAGINVPQQLVDVVLVLLVIFIVTAKIIVTPAGSPRSCARRCHGGGADGLLLSSCRCRAGARRALQPFRTTMRS